MDPPQPHFYSNTAAAASIDPMTLILSKPCSWSCERNPIERRRIHPLRQLLRFVKRISVADADADAEDGDVGVVEEVWR